MERQVREENALAEMKSIAFKCSSNKNEDVGHKEDDDKELSS